MIYANSLTHAIQISKVGFGTKWLAVAFAFCQFCGCSYFRPTTTTRPQDGLTLVLPGVEGASIFNSNIARGLVAGDVPGHIEVFEWTSGQSLRSLEHISDECRHNRQANRLARLIQKSQREDPTRPISLVSHSGGAGIALKALELLPCDHPVTSVVLIAPAVSRDYPIQKLAGKSEAGIWSFNSPLDLRLTLGTMLTGTMDGQHANSAGSFGFLNNARGLAQISYKPSMVLQGHFGGHLTPSNSSFVSHWIAPLVRQAHCEKLRDNCPIHGDWAMNDEHGLSLTAVQ